MQILKKSFKVPFEKIIQALEQNKPNSFIFLDSILLIFYFLQPLSYFFKLYNKNSTSFAFKTIRSIALYSNISNLLTYLESPIFSKISYILANLIIYIPILLICVFFISYQIFANSKKHLNLNFLPFFLSNLLYLHHWVLLLPLNDILLNIFLENDPFGTFHIMEAEAPMFLKIISILGIVANIMVGLIPLSFQKSMCFKDDKALNYGSFICLMMRIFFSILLPLYQYFEAIYHILLHIWLLYILYNYLFSFPIRNILLCRFYTSLLFTSELFALFLSLYHYSNLITEENLFYLVIFLGILAYKLGGKCFDTI